MNFNLLSDKIVFNSLKLIKHGFLEIQNHDNKIYKFGNENEQLRAKIKINKPGLTLQIIKSGSVGLAEAYMRNEFETDNLTNLIEITAKNIKIVYKFSGIFDLSMINKLKSIFIKNNKSRSKKNISNGLINLQEDNQKKLNDKQKKEIILGVERTPFYIFVFTEISENPEISEENYGAVCCAIQNMQLTATAIGLGVGWSTGKISKIYNLNNILGVDPSLKIVGVLSIGYPSSVAKKTRKDYSSLTKWL